MVADGMLTRKRYREVPPRVDYELTDRARELAPVLGELARWGYEWAWGPPRGSERVDIGAIFRLIPGLLSEGLPRTGTLELIVSDGREGQPVSYRVNLARGHATISEGAGNRTDAQVQGTTSDWVQALSPSADRSSLRLSGDRELGHALLDALNDTRTARAQAGPASVRAV
jgi:hypothetical protein